MQKIINISEALAIAIHCMVLIAYNKEKVNVSDLSRETGYSKNHIAKIMHILVKNNYLNSDRGPKGGFDLKRNAHEISLLELYELIEGKIEDYECTQQCRNCPVKSCLFGGLTLQFQNELLHYMRSNTIAGVKLKTKKIKYQYNEKNHYKN